MWLRGRGFGLTDAVIIGTSDGAGGTRRLGRATPAKSLGAAVMPQRQHVSALPDRPDRPRVLLVEPHEQTRVLLGQLLTDEGCDLVASVPNYAQAIVGAKTTRPTVIVTELYGGTVLTTAQYIASLRRYSPAPVIVHSVIVPDAAEVAEWRLWGAVVKGGEPARLLGMIRSAHDAASMAR
jgi:CheY-like chemotaxis protein